MDQEMEADEFFPDKMVSEPNAAVEENNASNLDDAVTQGDGGNSIVNGEGDAEEMETDEPASVRGEAMETAEEALEPENDLEGLVKEIETEDTVDAEEEIYENTGQSDDGPPGGNTETVKEDSEKQDLDNKEAEADENDVYSNLDLEAENLNEGLNNVSKNEMEMNKENDCNEDVLDLEEPLNETEQTEANENYGIVSQEENSAETNYTENIENFEVKAGSVVSGEVSQGVGSDNDEKLASFETKDTPEQEDADSESKATENQGTVEEREPEETERKPEEAERKPEETEREPEVIEEQDDASIDYDKEEDTSGIPEESAGITQTDAAVIEELEESEQTENAICVQEEETENVKKFDDSETVLEETETCQTEISQNIEEDMSDKNECNAVENSGPEITMDITGEKEESNINEGNDEAKEGINFTTGDKENGDESNIYEVKEDDDNESDWTHDDKEEKMDVESGAIESAEGISENIEVESEKAEDKFEDDNKSEEDSLEQKQNDQTTEETSKETVEDDETLKPLSETDSSDAGPTEESPTLMSERDSNTVSQASSTTVEKSSTPDSEGVSDETSGAISPSEVQPSGDNSNQSEAVLQSEATPSGDNSNQSDGTSDKKSPEFDMSNVKIKQERLNSTDSDKASESDNTYTGSSHMKIVGVTSAVGVEDKADNSEQISAKGDNADQKKTEKSSSNNDQLKVKQEALVAATVVEKEDVKKKLGEELKKKIKQESKPKEDEDDDVIAIKEEKKPVQKPKPSKIQTCIVCGKVGKCKYNIVRNGDVKHLCDDNCFKCFRSSPTTYLKQAETATQNQTKSDNQTNSKPAPAPVKTAAPVKATPSQQPSFQAQTQVYKTCTVCQLMNVRTSKPFLNWQGLDFCGEECLGKYQGGLSNNCSYCSGAIFPNNKAKFCCRVGSEVKHFCSANCNSDYVKRMKLCAFCNKDLAQSTDSFMAPVGETFKDFCSQECLQKFEDKNNKDLEIVGVQKGQKASKVPKGNYLCAVCGKVGPVKHEFKLDSKVNRLCSDPCFSAFQYANKLTLNTCDNCGTNLNLENQAPQYVQFEGQQRRFCSYMCVNSFRNTNKKTVPCAWCASKKSNFDMIERVDANNKYQLFCSLNCLSLYRVNLQATSNQAVTCDQCRKFVPAQYHLTMSDASVRNFCSYGCVMQFQAQFQAPAKQVLQHNSANNVAGVGRGQTQGPQPIQQQKLQQQQQTTTRSGRVVTKAAKVAETQQQQAGKGKGIKKDADSFPIISNVVSLAPQGTQHGQQQINIKSSTPVTVTNQQQGIKATTTTTGNQTVQQQIIIQPPPPKAVKNKSMLCKPFTQTKATSCRPHTQTKEVQTEGKAEPEKYLIPIPVPLYCPTPLAMYSVPTPILVPVPVPIPVPVFIPTTKKNANSILKQIKEIREKIPADPLEAELLMMAEAVAEKEDDSSSSSEEEDNTDNPAPPTKENSSTGGATASGGELGEDMLQMALRMASEMTDEPVMDLENSLEPVAVNTEPPPPPKPVIPTPEPVEEDDEYIPTSARGRRSRGTSKRQSRSTPRRNPKRQKVEITPQYREATPSPPAPVAPPPDANFHLKYTYGVNAFKHWVIQKNSQIEQTSKPGHGKSLRTFKTDILQCTADELNYSLCLFVKEVRKPNGEEYAVDSIYYLCLGIQQYLFENGRIDNIFTDFYYERFTEQLNEILTRYEPKLNHAGQLVCRIEEEHLWESKQLGAHSPHVLLNSLVYFNTKYFMLKTSEDHLKLSFTHIMKHWKKTATGRGSGTGPNAGRSVYLRYYCPTPQGKDNQKKKKEEMPVYEQTENLDNPLRCPVKLYEFYLSKCPESIKNRNDTFYLVPERSCVPDSPVWYSTGTLGIDQMAKMLNRIRLVREIQEAHLHTQPNYI